jgi:hypothetical protein
MDYIKMNRGLNEEGGESRSLRAKERDKRNPKISRFREIRFKSIEEVNEEGDYQQVSCKNQLKKPKLEPHKFKDNTTKSLLNKYNESLMENEFDDPGLVSISQQKQLNTRTTFCRRTQKDPFILIHRKDRLTKIS